MLARFGRSAVLVGNGVDRHRYTPLQDASDESLRYRLGLEDCLGPVFLSVGGVEARKNSVRVLDAFRRVRATLPGARLIIAGGSSLLDHHDAQSRFARLMAVSGLTSMDVIQTGPVLDADMPALYRLADALVFPSLHEGFGLVALEAMASGRPVVTSRIAPFTEHFGGDDVVWCDPVDVGSIAAAMLAAVEPETRQRLGARGVTVAARYDWASVAAAHLATYATLREPHHA